jgi:LPXTG-site transpeptidase (sortase) family protein
MTFGKSMQKKILSRRIILILIGFVLLAAFLFYFVPKSLIFGDSGLTDSFAFASFSDVSFTHPNYEAINYLQVQNIVSGYPGDGFRPDNPINRAEFTKIITEAYYKGQAGGSNCFPDVGTEWFAKYVCFTKTLNFISGYPDGSFKPANNINFAEIAKILVNVKGITVTPDPVTWYKPYVEKLAGLNAVPASISGFGQKVTRGEMAEMVYRLRTDVTDKPSKTYEELVIENAAYLLKQEQARPGLPVRLKIPGINVDSAFEYVGLTSQGAVGIPLDPNNAAWYNLGPRPGDVGSAVITGHVNWYYGATGVFANLRKVKPGDKIVVQDDKGADISFVVREIRSYDAAADAVDVFISNDGKAHLNLITCEGVWDRSAQQYTKRLVVFADKEGE